MLQQHKELNYTTEITRDTDEKFGLEIFALAARAVALVFLVLLVGGAVFHFVVIGLHGGEEENLLDIVGVGEEHGQAIDAHAPASGGRETVFQSSAKAFVQEHGLVIT